MSESESRMIEILRILAKQDREGYNTSLCVHLFVGILQKLSLNIPEQREV